MKSSDLPTPAPSETLRAEAAAALRGLLHAFVSSDCDDAELARLRDWAHDETAALAGSPTRSRLLAMQRAIAAADSDGSADSGGWQPGTGPGFEDRAVGGDANPTSLVFDKWRDGDTMLAEVT